MLRPACELVVEILQYTATKSALRHTRRLHVCRIVIDTNNFMSKTGVRTFEAAAFLKRNGTDVVRVHKMFRETAAEYQAKALTVSSQNFTANIL